MDRSTASIVTVASCMISVSRLVIRLTLLSTDLVAWAFSAAVAASIDGVRPAITFEMPGRSPTPRMPAPPAALLVNQLIHWVASSEPQIWLQGRPPDVPASWNASVWINGVLVWVAAAVWAVPKARARSERNAT